MDKNDIVAKYNPSSLHTTGHSKGGAEADLIAAELDCYATTWVAPNPYRILSPEAKRRVDEGKWTIKQLIIHMKMTRLVTTLNSVHL